MELKVTTLEGKAVGSVQLSDAIFGLEPRVDIIQRCVNWQLAKRQAEDVAGNQSLVQPERRISRVGPHPQGHAEHDQGGHEFPQERRRRRHGTEPTPASRKREEAETTSGQSSVMFVFPPHRPVVEN